MVFRDSGGTAGGVAYRHARRQVAKRASLHEEVAEDGRLFGTGEHAPAGAIGGELVEQIVPRSSTDDVEVVDPTGAGDSFAGGFVGWLAQNTAGSPTDEALRLAMAYGTAIASYNVEELGTDRVARLTIDEVHERVADIQALTQFSLEISV